MYRQLELSLLKKIVGVFAVSTETITDRHHPMQLDVRQTKLPYANMYSGMDMNWKVLLTLAIEYLMTVYLLRQKL